MAAIAIVGFGLVSGSAQGAVDDETDLDAFLAKLSTLRAAGDFDSAEDAARAALADSHWSEADRAMLAVDLSRTLVDHALRSTPDESEPRWQEAREVVRRFLLEYPRNPRLVFVQAQGMLVDAARGEAWRQQSELAPHARDVAARARDALRQAIREMGDLAERLAELRARRGRAKADARDAPTADELRALEYNLRLQRGLAELRQARLFDDKSPEHADLLSQAAGDLQPLATLDEAHSVVWPARVAWIECLRLGGQIDEASSRIKQFSEPPIAHAPALRVEAIRVAIADEKLTEARQLAAAPRPDDWPVWPDLDLAALELLLAERRADSPVENTATPSGSVAELTARIARQHGAYWARRAEMLLAKSATATGAESDPTALSAAGDGLARAEQWDEALVAYDRAIAAATAANHAEAAFDLGYRAAAVEHRRQRHVAAAERFRALALDHPKHARAAEAHLLALYNTAQAARVSQGASQADYEERLAEHLRHWPAAESAGEVRWQLGRLRQAERHWQAAIEAYRGVGALHARSTAAIEAMGDCYLSWLAELKAAGQSLDALRTAAWNDLVALTLDARGTPLDRLDARGLAAAENAARTQLAFATPRAADAERLLRRALDAPELPTSRREALQLLIAWSVAAQGRGSEATPLIDQAIQSSPESLFAFLRDSEMADEATGEKAARTTAADASPQGKPQDLLSQLRRRAAETLFAARDRLAPAERDQCLRWHAQALIAQQRFAEAERLFEQLAESQPADTSALEQYARLLAQRDDRPSLESALAKWRQVERRRAADSPGWYEAKYELARLHERLGDKQQAAKIVIVTRALHPELGGDAWRAKFLELLARCQKP